jgi:hypothetical protein
MSDEMREPETEDQATQVAADGDGAGDAGDGNDGGDGGEGEAETA